MPSRIQLIQNPSAKFLLERLGYSDIAGFEVYENVILAYTSDMDVRLRIAVDVIDDYQDELFLAHVKDGILSLFWLTEVPEKFRKGQVVKISDGTGQSIFWTIDFSKHNDQIKAEYERKSEQDLRNLINRKPSPN